MPAYKDEKTGKWFAKFYYTNWQGIKKQKWKRGFATKKEALGFERDFLEKQSANPDMTFQNLYEIYIEDMAARLKQSTLLTKKAVLQTHILPFFGSKPINEIKASDVRRWQAKLMSSPNNYSQTYLKKINTELNSIINYAKRFYDLNTNPCGKAGTIGKAKAEEMDYWTGMREGELLALSPADIDLDNKTISINRTYQRIEGKDVFTSPKTRKSKRKIPIPDFLCQELSDYIQSRYMLDADERLFPVTKSYLSHEMIRGCKNTGIKKIRIHDIRHSHASLLINQGCDALMLADRLGHEKVSTTLNTYSHLFPHKQQELVHSLESLQATDSPTPEPPSDNPLLEAAGITCEVPQTQSNGSDVTARPQFGPSLVPPNTASGKIIQMPQRKII